MHYFHYNIKIPFQLNKKNILWYVRKHRLSFMTQENFEGVSDPDFEKYCRDDSRFAVSREERERILSPLTPWRVSPFHSTRPDTSRVDGEGTREGKSIIVDQVCEGEHCKHADQYSRTLASPDTFTTGRPLSRPRTDSRDVIRNVCARSEGIPDPGVNIRRFLWELSQFKIARTYALVRCLPEQFFDSLYRAFTRATPFIAARDSMSFL